MKTFIFIALGVIGIGFLLYRYRGLSLNNWGKRPDNWNSLTDRQRAEYNAALSRAARVDGSQFE